MENTEYITATARTAHMEAILHLPTNDGELDEAALRNVLARRGIISADIRSVYIENIDGWEYAVCDVDSEGTIASLEIHAGAGV
jgi:hypothetical protein